MPTEDELNAMAGKVYGFERYDMLVPTHKEKCMELTIAAKIADRLLQLKSAR